MNDENKGPERREIDPVQQKIEELIEAEQDPKDRAFLMILNKMAKNLEVNTELTQNLSTELKAHTTAFSEHERKEMAAWNYGRGLQRGAIIFLMAANLLVGFIINEHIATDKQTRQDLAKLSDDFIAHAAKVEAHMKAPGAK